MNNIFERNSIVIILYLGQRKENITLCIQPKRRKCNRVIPHYSLPYIIQSQTIISKIYQSIISPLFLDCNISFTEHSLLPLILTRVISHLAYRHLPSSLLCISAPQSLLYLPPFSPFRQFSHARVIGDTSYFSWSITKTLPLKLPTDSYFLLNGIKMQMKLNGG